METTNSPESQSGKTLIKGLNYWCPYFIIVDTNRIYSEFGKEREMRQKEVAKEVSSKWASSQTLSGPFFYVPYQYPINGWTGKSHRGQSLFLDTPDNLKVTGGIDHQVRPRSIYKVLLYRANVKSEGNFILNIPDDVDRNAIQWKDVRICYGLSDFKGIEEKMLIKFNETENELSPGLAQTGYRCCRTICKCILNSGRYW